MLTESCLLPTEIEVIGATFCWDIWFMLSSVTQLVGYCASNSKSTLSLTDRLSQSQVVSCNKCWQSCLFIVAHYSHLPTLLMCVSIPCRMPFNFCTQCGTKLQPTFRFCPSCGEKLPCPGSEPAPASLTVSSGLSPTGKDEVASALEKSPARATKRKSKYILVLFCSDLPQTANRVPTECRL